jgi:hypothetical protein
MKFSFHPEAKDELTRRSNITYDDSPPVSRAAILISAGVAALLLSVAGNYGIFRDEYYYLMCAAHPDWGFVDHPPLAMIFLTVWKALFGVSTFSLHVPPALLGGAAAFGASLLARDMGGKAGAQSLAAAVTGLMTGILALSAFFSMNSFDVVFWIVAALIAGRILQDGGSWKTWLSLGVVFGLGLQNKYSMAFLGGGLLIGFLLSPARRDLFSLKTAACCGIAFLIFLPHVIWQISHDWPSLEFIRNARDIKNASIGPAVFWGQELLMAHPFFAPVWIIGLAGLMFSARLRRWRPLGIAFIVVAVYMSLTKSKPYYLVPAYPMLMAAGAVAISEWFDRLPRISRITRIAFPALAVLAGLAIAPLAIPLLSPSDYIAYEQTLGLRPKNMENSKTGALPQHFADRFGWVELALTVRGVVETVQKFEWPKTLVVTNNYGECGAINYWGLPEGVPPAVSGHNNCYLWWPADFTPEVVVLIGDTRKNAERYFESVQPAAVHRNRWAMPFESELTIWICRGLKLPAAELRERARFYI